MDRYYVIGLMSGTSMDGLDIAYCELQLSQGKWLAQVVNAETVKYNEYWLTALSTVHEKSAAKLIQLHGEYGDFIGQQVKAFIKKYKVKTVDVIASHGHTIFHQPDNGYTFQLGSGANISAYCGIATVCDFRTKDVALGGQGAPLVPIGDELLFGDYDYCLNLGGFANISYQQDGKRRAFDICPVNTVLNSLAAKEGLEFDENGDLAAGGHLNEALLNQLDGINFFKQEPPKSLGREWLETEYMPILRAYEIPTADKLRTACESMANQIGKVLGSGRGKRMLITGGGAFNRFLVKLINQKTTVECMIPEKEVVNFKEALVFAFLGVLRLRNEVNCLASVTGATRDSIGGCVYSTRILTE